MFVNKGIIDRYCNIASLIPASLAVFVLATRMVASAEITSDDAKLTHNPIKILFADIDIFKLLKDTK